MGESRFLEAVKSVDLILDCDFVVVVFALPAIPGSKNNFNHIQMGFELVSNASLI